MNKAVAFFEQHAGFSYDPENETEDQGRARCAKELAAAEARASEEGYSFHWAPDTDVLSSDWIEDNEDGGRNRDPWHTWFCIARDAEGSVRAALSGIDFGRDRGPWGYTDRLGRRYGHHYRRVVEAELAAEGLAASLV